MSSANHTSVSRPNRATSEKRKQDNFGTQTCQQHPANESVPPQWDIIDPDTVRAVHEVQQQSISTFHLLERKLPSVWGSQIHYHDHHFVHCHIQPIVIHDGYASVFQNEATG